MIVETRYSGVLMPAELTAAVRETLAVGQRQGYTRFLGDCTELAGGHSIVDLYNLVDLVESARVGLDIKEAVLLPVSPASAEAVRFWETACLNRGAIVRIFTDREHALDWLLDRQSADAGV